METLKIFNYQKNAVSFRKSDNGNMMVNATEMARPFGKRPTKWLELPSTVSFLETLAKVRKSHTSNVRFSDTSNNQLVMSQMGSPENGGGTWMHEDVALEFARWLNPEFAIWCNDRIKELLTNGLTASDNMLKQILDDPDVAIGILMKLKEERNMNAVLHAKVEEQEAVIDEQKGKVAFADAVADSSGSILIGELATILKQNGLDFGQNRLFAWLRSNGYLCKGGERYNQPTSIAMNNDLFEIKKTSITKPNGTILVTTTTKVTGKGQIYFLNKLQQMMIRN